MASIYNYAADDASFLGFGQFGQVFRGTNTETTEKIAVKKVPKKDDEGYMKTLRREVEVMKEIDHPNLVKLYDYEESQSFICFYLEFCDAGNLDQYVQNTGTITMDQKLEMMAQCASGIRYMHVKNIVHRDLKPENILLKTQNGKPVAKVADFGFARHTPSAGSFNATYCGTPNYMAPEMNEECKEMNEENKERNEKHKARYSLAVDIFALGLVFLAFVEHKGDKQRLKPLKGNNLPLGSWMRKRNDQDVQALLMIDEERDQYVKQVTIMVTQMLKIVACNRLTIQQVCDAIKDIEDEKKAAEMKQLTEANDRLQQDKNRLEQEKGGLVKEKNQLVQEKAQLVQEKAQLVQEKDQLVQGKDQLEQEKKQVVQEKDQLVHENNQLVHEKNRLAQESSKVMEANEKLQKLLGNVVSSYDTVENSLSEAKASLGINK